MKTRAGQAMDTGLRSGPENIRLDRAQWREAQRAEAPFCHVRFHRYLPTASLGALETPGHALRSEYCRRRDIDIVRRITGGGTVYLDPRQLCWTLTLSCAPGDARRLADWMALLGEGVAAALQRQGVRATFVPPNDIEVEGRKLASGFLAVSDTAVLYQGSILFDLDAETMMKALRVPTEKLSPEGVRSARHRFAVLRELAPYLDAAALQQSLLAAWAERLDTAFAWQTAPCDTKTASTDYMGATEDWDAETGFYQQALVKTSGGVLHARLRLSRDGGLVQHAEFAGGVHVFPGHLFVALSSALAMAPVSSLGGRLDDFFRVHPHDMLGFTPEDIRHVLHLALDRRAQRKRFALSNAQANTLMVHAPHSQEAAAIVGAASVMLVPYCAKPSWCKWRHRDGCPECGQCEVGEAYRLARERGMRVITITNFEHLEKTLGALRARGTEAYVGMCCRHFYLKREYAFREAGIPAVLMDITGANCYELQQEDLAYEGKFEAQAHLDLDVLRKVMERVPPVTDADQRAAKR